MAYAEQLQHCACEFVTIYRIVMQDRFAVTPQKRQVRPLKPRGHPHIQLANTTIQRGLKDDCIMTLPGSYGDPPRRFARNAGWVATSSKTKGRSSAPNQPKPRLGANTPNTPMPSQDGTPSDQCNRYLRQRHDHPRNGECWIGQ